MKRGRKPTTGLGRGVHVRFHQPLLAALDEAAKADGLSRPAAIRRALVEWLAARGLLQRENGE